MILPLMRDTLTSRNGIHVKEELDINLMVGGNVVEVGSERLEVH